MSKKTNTAQQPCTLLSILPLQEGAHPDTLMKASRFGSRSFTLSVNKQVQTLLPLYINEIISIATLQGIMKLFTPDSEKPTPLPALTRLSLQQLNTAPPPAAPMSAEIEIRSKDRYPTQLFLAASPGNEERTLEHFRTHLSNFSPAALDFAARHASDGHEGLLLQFGSDVLFMKFLMQLGAVSEQLNQSLPREKCKVHSRPLFAFTKQIYKDLHHLPFKRELFHLFKHSALGLRVDKSPHGTKLRAECSTAHYPDSRVVAYTQAFMKGQSTSGFSSEWNINPASLQISEWERIETELFRGVQHRMCAPSKSFQVEDLAEIQLPAIRVSSEGDFMQFIHTHGVITVNRRLRLCAMQINAALTPDSATQAFRNMFLKAAEKPASKPKKDINNPVYSQPVFMFAQQVYQDLHPLPFKRELFHLFKHSAQGVQVDKSSHGTKLRTQCTTANHPGSRVVAYIEAFTSGKPDNVSTADWAVDPKTISVEDWERLENNLFSGVQHRMCVPKSETW